MKEGTDGRMQGVTNVDVQQIINTIVQFPVAAIVIWLFFKLSEKHEKFVQAMQDDWQAFIKEMQKENMDRDKGYQEALREFGNVLRDHTYVLKEAERARQHNKENRNGIRGTNGV
jgi:hypothetical protein